MSIYPTATPDNRFWPSGALPTKKILGGNAYIYIPRKASGGVLTAIFLCAQQAISNSPFNHLSSEGLIPIPHYENAVATTT